MHDEEVKLALNLANSTADVSALNTSLTVLDKNLDKAAVSTEKLGSKSVNTGQQLLQTGRVVQDFAQGGLGGILNNIEGLSVALGLGSGLAGVLTVLGVAALVAGPAIKGFFKGLIDGSNDIPKSTDHVKQLGEELKKTTDRLDELTKQQHLTNTELKEFNALSLQQEQIEKRLRASREAEAAKKVLAPEERKAGEAIKKAIDAFGGQAVYAEVERALIAAGAAGARGGQAGRTAEDLISRSKAGDASAQQLTQDVLRRSAAGGGVAGVLLGGATPDEQAKAKAEADKKRADEWNKAEKDRQAAARRLDELNQLGRENEARTLEAQQKERDEGIALGRRAGEAAAKLPPRGEASLKGLDLGHLPFISEPGTDIKTMQGDQDKMMKEERAALSQLLQNQANMTLAQRQFLQMLMRTSKEVEAAIGTNRTANTNGFQ